MVEVIELDAKLDGSVITTKAVMQTSVEVGTPISLQVALE